MSFPSFPIICSKTRNCLTISCFFFHREAFLGSLCKYSTLAIIQINSEYALMQGSDSQGTSAVISLQLFLV